ncbi:MAG: calcium/sodium antiporter [Candidatus Altiarchaeota archaeon]|nr:calcium/sodium antiporter [Candidatus Altiarchaeota archaeon]
MMLLLMIVFFVLSVYMIMKGSDWITDSSIHVAHRIGTSNLAVGLIVISFLLSIPEIVIATSAILKGHPALGFGTVIGSVIVNIGLIVGISALIRPLRVPRIMVTRDMIFMVVVSIVVVAMALEDRNLSRGDGLVFILLFIPYVINVYEQERNLTHEEKKLKTEKMTEALEMHGKYDVNHKTRFGIKYFIAGVFLLIVGSEIFVRIMLEIASLMQLSDLLVGITIGALGPSIPNLAAALGAARKGVEELVVSETIGSNIFTLLITLGLIALINPMTIDDMTASITAPALLIITFILLVAMLKGHVRRRDGLILVLFYLATVIAEFVFRRNGGI